MRSSSSIATAARVEVVTPEVQAVVEVLTEVVEEEDERKNEGKTRSSGRSSRKRRSHSVTVHQGNVEW